jgi:mono/diheme cytochrome c family protein
MRHTHRILFFGLALLPACTGTDTTPEETGPTYYTDVKPILDGRCVSCHSKGDIGPFALDTYAAAKATKEQIVTRTSARTMPPWGADAGDTKYKFDPSLSDDQIATLKAWVDAGAPEGDPAKEGAALPSVDQKLSRVDLTLKMPEAYTPTLSPDEYRCFILDWPEQETMFVTGFNANPGQRSIDHHIAAFLVRPDNPVGPSVFDTLAQLDAEDPEPGYKCFGGPAGSSDVQIPAQQIGQWVPGQGGGDFPAGSGIKVPPGSKIVLQMHYSLANGNVPADLTTIDMKIDKTVDKMAAFAPWLDPAWVDGGMPIPAGEKDVMHERTGDPRGFFKLFVADMDVAPGFVMHSVMLHMHRLGKSATVRMKTVDGTEKTLLSVSSWNFNWQRLYQLEEPVTFHKGDQLTVECHWDNSQEAQPVVDGVKQPPKDVNWGEGTVDEMCVDNNYIVEP